MTTPLCCPSRASILRGQYAHNHRVLRNTGDDAGFTAYHASGNEPNTIATELDAAGNETALIGKYLNGYVSPRRESSYIPPGWDFWVAGVDHDAYGGFNYDLNVNGEIVHHGEHARDYMTDVLAAHALDFLDRSARSNRPFFLYLATCAPHSPSSPAPRHQGMFAGESAPRTHAFNERNIQDKPHWMQSSRLSEEQIERIDSGYRRRLESLMAVDEMIDVVVQRLEERGALANTYLLFLSDNGYFLGEHRQPHGKVAPYDAASRVPLIARSWHRGGVIDRQDRAQYRPVPDHCRARWHRRSTVRGRALSGPTYHGRRQSVAQCGVNRRLWQGDGVQRGAETSTPPFRALRSEEMLFAEYETGERELCYLRKAPHQMANIAREAPKSLLRNYSRRLDALAACAGSECGRLENDPIPKLSTAAAAKRDGKEKSETTGKSKAKGKPDRAKIEQRRSSARQRDQYQRLHADDRNLPGQRERDVHRHGRRRR